MLLALRDQLLLTDWFLQTARAGRNSSGFAANMLTGAATHVLGGGDYHRQAACQSDVHVGVRCSSVCASGSVRV